MKKEKPMSLEVKRVPLDFNWPINTTWGGYKNPFATQQTQCPTCNGSGGSRDLNYLRNLWYGYETFRPEDKGSTPYTPDHPIIQAKAKGNLREAQRLCDHFNGAWLYHLDQDDVDALVEEGRLRDLTSTWSRDGGWQRIPGKVVTAQMVNEWALTGFGHDAINQWIVTEAQCKRLGHPTTCPNCNGEGSLWPSETIKEQYDEWVKLEPPTGEGWQMWEDVSDGSPCSPVFDTPEKLAEYMERNPWGIHNQDYSGWLEFITKHGHSVCSMVVAGGVLMDGVTAALATH